MTSSLANLGPIFMKKLLNCECIHYANFFSNKIMFLCCTFNVGLQYFSNMATHIST